MSLLETLVILAIFSLVVGLATSGLRSTERQRGSAGILAKITTEISIHRNNALRAGSFLQVNISEIGDAIDLPELKACDADVSPSILIFKDGTIRAPDLCLNDYAQTHISIDWLTGQPNISTIDPP